MTNRCEMLERFLYFIIWMDFWKLSTIKPLVIHNAYLQSSHDDIYTCLHTTNYDLMIPSLIVTIWNNSVAKWWNFSKNLRKLLIWKKLMLFCNHSSWTYKRKEISFFNRFIFLYLSCKTLGFLSRFRITISKLNLIKYKHVSIIRNSPFGRF